LEVVEESFDEVGDCVGITDGLDVLEITVVYLFVCLGLLFYRNALSKYALCGEMLRSVFEVVDEDLKDDWDSHFSYFKCIDGDAYFRNQGFDVFLVLFLLEELRLC
jgi:hypothetical protein